MLKSELIDYIEANSDLNKTEVRKVLALVTLAIKTTLVNGGSVSVRGIGKFYVKSMKARKGRNIRTGGAVIIPARLVVGCKVDALLNKFI